MSYYTFLPTDFDQSLNNGYAWVQNLVCRENLVSMEECFNRMNPNHIYKMLIIVYQLIKLNKLCLVILSCKTTTENTLYIEF